jgi:hypothetical protein
VLVLDGKNGGLTVEVRVDARAGAQVPLGGVDTGAGGTAPFPWAATTAVVLVSVLIAGGALMAMRRRAIVPVRPRRRREL